MAIKEFSRRQKALALVPLALLSGAWTASLVGSSASAAGDRVNDDHLPDGTSVPTQAIEAPANLPSAGVIAPGVPSGSADQVVDGASTGGIPSAALTAYQRAAQIIDSADKTCHIPWELIGAIGRVESDHGRYGGNVLSPKGVSQPGIYGIALNGKNGTQVVRDTDGGTLDKDKVYDRAVGPMQFIPSTWQVVKVDADGDGRRNPQDIDDASLATAVYLCSGSENLGNTAGQKSAVFRYNHSQQYVDLVLRLMRAYQSGDYTAVPNDASGGQTLSYSDSTAMSPLRKQARAKLSRQRGATLSGSGGSSASSGGSTSGSSGTSDGSGTSTLPGSGSSGGGSGSSGGGLGGLGGVVGKVTGGSGGSGGGKTPAPVKPVVKTLNQLGQATSYCLAHLPSTLSGSSTAVSKCAGLVGNKTKAQADASIGGIVAQLLKDLGGGLLGG